VELRIYKSNCCPEKTKLCRLYVLCRASLGSLISKVFVLNLHTREWLPTLEETSSRPPIGTFNLGPGYRTVLYRSTVPSKLLTSTMVYNFDSTDAKI
jgi:hypothetical protein